MPYTPTVWHSGDVVTSEKLNKLEQGVADATSEEIIDSWLEENISQETGYALDRTLTLENAAAPADLVGDLKSALDSLTTKTENELHTLLTETTPLGTYGNSVANGYLWIFKDIPVPAGQQGVVRVLTTGGDRTYHFCTLKKNSDTSYTILTDETKLSSAVSVDEYEISADTQDIYIGLYSADGALVFSSANVGVNDGISRALYQDFINGEGTATTAILGTSLNFGFALTTSFYTVSSGFPIKIVDKNGRGDFATISDAINGTNDGDTLLIMPGTYFEKVKMWGKNRHLVGLSKENTIIASTSRYYNNEPLQANIGSVTNLTFIAGYGLTPIEDDTSSTSYAIHIEYANSDPFEFVIDNCNIISNVAPAVGMGVRYNQTVKVRNSRLETKAKNMYSSVYDNYFNVGGIFCHNDASGSGLGTDGRVEVTDCELKGVLTAITLQSQDNGNTLICRFVNNLLWSTQNGKTDAVTIRTPATQGHLAGSDVLLDAMSFGNNVSELNS